MRAREQSPGTSISLDRNAAGGKTGDFPCVERRSKPAREQITVSRWFRCFFTVVSDASVYQMRCIASEIVHSG